MVASSSVVVVVVVAVLSVAAVVVFMVVGFVFERRWSDFVTGYVLYGLLWGIRILQVSCCRRFVVCFCAFVVV